MITITRIFGFDSGHRVLGHEGKCANLHGHRYTAEVTVTAQGLDKIGRVIDFSVIKRDVGNWIDTCWDHNMILHEKDPLALMLADGEHGALHTTTHRYGRLAVFGPKTPFVMPDEMNPTAENMAAVLFHQAQEILKPFDLTVVHVRLYETPNCFADVNTLPLFTR